MNGEDVTFLTLTIPGREALLQRCVRSVYTQTIAPYAHFVMADRRGSKDVGRAYNELAAAVTTPWMHFLDDDNFLRENHLERILPAFAGADVVYSYETSKSRPRVDVSKWSQTERVERFRRENFIDNSCAIRTELFRELGGFSEDCPAPKDWELMQRLTRVNAKFRCVPEETWTYQQYRHNGQVMDAREIRKLEGHVDGVPLSYGHGDDLA